MVWRDIMGTLSGRAKLVINSIKADTDRTHRIRKSSQIKLELRVGNRKHLYFFSILLFIENILKLYCYNRSTLIIRYCSIIGQYYLFSLVRAGPEYWCYVRYPIISSGKFHPSSAPTDQENKDGRFENFYFLLWCLVTSGDWSVYDWL